MSQAPLVEGITAAVVGITGFEKHTALYCDELGFEVVGSGVVPGKTASVLWQTGGVDLRVRVLAAAGAETGRIALVEVPHVDPATAQHPHTADIGLAAIDLYTRDIQVTHRELTAAGYPWLTPPATYQVPLGERSVTVTEGFCLAPDGTDVVFVEPANPRGTAAWAADPDRFYTELTSVVCHVPDFEMEVAFWGPDGLGLGLWYDVTFSSEGFEAMTGVPPGTRMRLAFLAGANTARIEVTHMHDNRMGVDRRDRQRPGRALGHSGWLVRTTDLDAAVQRAVDRKGRLLSDAADTDDVLFGRGQAVSVDTPNGIAVTFYEVRS